MWSAPAERSRDGAFLQPRRSRLGQELAILFFDSPIYGARTVRTRIRKPSEGGKLILRFIFVPRGERLG